MGITDAIKDSVMESFNTTLSTTDIILGLFVSLIAGLFILIAGLLTVSKVRSWEASAASLRSQRDAQLDTYSRLYQTLTAAKAEADKKSAAADALRQRYPTVPIIGMEPALLPALRISKHPKVAVLATAATLRSQKFRNLMKMHAKSAHVWQISAPGIVRLVEKGRADSPEMDAYLRSLLAPLPTLPDAVVLGCTHFPFAKPSLARVLGSVPCFDGAAGTARELKRRLQALELETDTPGTGGILLTSSDPTALPLFSRLLSQSNA